MKNGIETVYYLENPEKNLITFATSSQLKYEDIIKDVFGIACLEDLPMMVKYNKSFQDSICTTHGVRENEITVDMVFHVASKNELLQLKKQYSEEHHDTQEEFPCPFKPLIRLREGIFSWDQENGSYNKVKSS